MNIIIIGNCQSTHIKWILQTITDSSKHKIDSILVNTLTAEDEERVCKLLSKQDLIITQRIYSTFKFEFVQTDFIRNNFKTNILQIPNLYFRGNTPDLIYLSLKNTRILSPLGDYHHHCIYECWKNKKNIKDTVKFVQSENLMKNHPELFSSVESSLNELKEREEVLDIKISDFIEKNWKTKRLFFTFNHPTTLLLLTLVKRIMKHSNIDFHKIPEAYILGELLNNIIPLTYSSINKTTDYNMSQYCKAKKVIFTTDNFTILKSPEIMNIWELVEKSFKMYDIQLKDKNLNELRIS